MTTEAQAERNTNCDAATRSDIVEYLSKMSASMARLARNWKLEALAHLFDMAAMEAKSELKKTGN